MGKREKINRIISNLLTASVIIWGGFSGVAAYLGIRPPGSSPVPKDEISPGIVYNFMEERESSQASVDPVEDSAREVVGSDIFAADNSRAGVPADADGSGILPEAVSGGGEQVSQAVPPKTDKININTASSETLQNLKGIGPSKASNIIEYRETYGAFVAIEEIKEVKGIGEKTFENIKDFICVE